jgi:predicted AlkP superfamily phosphohydrolase/phosphomutase
MDVALTRRWAAAGYLRTFRRLFESAAWTDYTHPPELTSGAVFPSINTGLGPLRHLGQEYLRLREGSYRLRYSNAADIQGDPFWKAFAMSGRRVVLADVPFMIPDPAYGGTQFWGWGVHDLWTWRRSSVPPRLLRSLSVRFGTHPVPYCHDYTPEADSLLRLRAGLLEGIERRTAMFRSLMLNHEWELFYGVYSEAHCAGHLMWHLEDESHPQHRPDDVAVVGHPLRDVYAALDRGLETLLGCAGSDTICLVFFSHGMGPNYHGGRVFQAFVDRFNQQWTGTPSAHDGSQPARSASGLECLWKASIARLPVAWRKRARERLPMSLRGWVYMKRSQRPGRWSRMPAFALPSDGFSALRVNLAGRDPHGRIHPGEEYRRYLAAFTEALAQSTNADTGAPVVERLFRADQHLDPMTMRFCADLIVWWSKATPIRAIRSPGLGLLTGEGRDLRTGEHVMRGVLLLSHPRANAGYHAIEGMSAMDIAATLCDLGAVRPSTAFDGVSRSSLLMADSRGPFERPRSPTHLP